MVDHSISVQAWGDSEQKSPVFSTGRDQPVLQKLVSLNTEVSVQGGAYEEMSARSDRSVKSAPDVSETATERSSTDISSSKLENERGRWPNQCEFLLTLVGFTINFGNFVRFPTQAIKYRGGAFFIPYTICLFILSLPLTYFELLLGQYIGRGPVKIFGSLAPIFKGLGWAAITVSAILALYYPSFIAWAFIYIVNSFREKLPWSTCHNTWNTKKCYSVCDNAACAEKLNISGAFMFAKKCYPPNSTVFATYREGLNNNSIRSAAVEFFDYNVYNTSSNVNHLQWQLCVATLAVWVVCFFCAIRGFRSFGLTIYFFGSFPFVTLLLLLILALTRTGAGQGIEVFLSVEIDQLLTVGIWKDAAMQLVYSSIVGRGVLSTVASFNYFHHGLLKHALILCAAGAVASFMAGLVVFGNFGYLAHELGVDPNEFISDKTQFVLSIYVEAFATMPGAQAWSFLLFFMFASLGIVLLFVTIDTLATAICDQKPILRQRQWMIRAAICTLFYLIGLIFCTEHGIYLLSIFDSDLNYPKSYVCLLELVCVIWVYGRVNWSRNIREMQGKRHGWLGKVLKYYWCTNWSVITPLALCFLIVAGLATCTNKTSVPNEDATSSQSLLAQFFMFLPLMVTLGFASTLLINRLRLNRPLAPLFQATKYWTPEHRRARDHSSNRIQPSSAHLDMKTDTSDYSTLID